MPQNFDPYHKWLGIPPNEQPPNHYRLLALGLFESDSEVIDAAANRQMAYVQQRATGEHTALSQKLLNELSAARLCLLNAKKRSAYDAELKTRLGGALLNTGRTEPTTPDPLAFLESTTSTEDRSKSEKLAVPKQKPLKTAASLEYAVQSQSVPKVLPHLPSTVSKWSWKIIIGSGVGGIAIILLIAWLVFRGGKKGADVAQVPSFLDQSVAAQGQKDHAAASDEKRPAEPHDASLSSPQPKTGEATAAAGRPPEANPRRVEPATYLVEIDPPNADLRVSDDKGTITGAGKQRTVTVEHPDRDTYVFLFAECKGYRNGGKGVNPSPGARESVAISLERIGFSPEVRPQVGGSVPADEPSSPLNMPRSHAPGRKAKGVSPKKWKPQSAPVAKPAAPVAPVAKPAEPKTQRRKVFHFTGQSAILTPVQRSLPLTVEAWIWIPPPAETADMFVFGSDSIDQQFSGLGVRINKDGHVGGKRSQRSKESQDFATHKFVPLAKWTHLAVTFEVDKIRFFINGKPIHDDAGAQSVGKGPLVIGYIGYGPYKYPNCFLVGKIRTVRITSGARYSEEFVPDIEFTKNLDKKNLRTLLVYDASRTKSGSPVDLSGNHNHGQSTGVRIEEAEVPVE